MPLLDPFPAQTIKCDEADLAQRAAAKDAGAIREILQLNNRRLYRIARAILRDDGEAEDAVQEAYIRAFSNIGGFKGESALSTWLSRIVMNEALGRLRQKKRAKWSGISVSLPSEAEIIPFPLNSEAMDPERTMAQRQILRLVERATDALPEAFRTVFVARVIEGLSLEETSAILGIRPETVKTRLHRARNLIRAELEATIGPVFLDAFPFAGRRCERMTEAVLKRVATSD
ncbi:MAG: RNA polymerase sigma factor [Rhizobiales bacterium]|nr:RNA polymerase sigma factor [Hyphomicrobiales bacterium]